MMDGRRRAGVLAHVTALPGPGGMGDFGPGTRTFLDFLAEAGQGIWQILPLAPTNTGAGNSPYSGYSAFAWNPLLISPHLLVRDGLLSPQDVRTPPVLVEGRVDFAAQAAWRTALLDAAYDAAWPKLSEDRDFLAFCQEHAAWLEDWAVFAALKRQTQGAPWYQWDAPLRLRHPQAVEAARQRLGFWIQRERFVQYLAARQWRQVLEYAARLGIVVLGDVPIYVSLDSCDVWAHREIFQLDREGRPIFSAGAPPDYFSATGQMWGNPVYDWEHLARTGYAWWVQRLAHERRRLHAIRLDHFRGFCAYWQVPACEPTAENGVWVPGPGRPLFDAVRAQVPDLWLVAEDLGVITEDVRALMESLGLPGMRVLQFAFGGGAENPYLPHQIPEQAVAYTGTHDNNTVRGWWEHEAGPEVRAHVEAYWGRPVQAETVADALIRLALLSRARWAVVPLQDYLGLGSAARFNTPGVAYGNWAWCAPADACSPRLASRMRELAQLYGRTAEARGA
ncbi:4-alpha-glucanotransferase [Thermodesulfomicrobium sp. WS]|uniref:4-alpha-glucanotransferase n=1 Tax=Thermodesulfomicrobium sp. WS TaxID=3004129 RepID=UPI0024911F56|nr:4-alpha-glucanotransferase [Thermodesulfomicrobium sp. WS]BDV00382.1 4-alpha-glucanotransferase [Thermodesulfomicrobium sp. WS]